MSDAEKSKPLINWAAIGPIIQVVIIAAGMFMGFAAMSEQQKTLARDVGAVSQRVEKLYELLVYPSVANGKRGQHDGT